MALLASSVFEEEQVNPFGRGKKFSKQFELKWSRLSPTASDSQNVNEKLCSSSTFIYYTAEEMENYPPREIYIRQLE